MIAEPVDFKDLTTVRALASENPAISKDVIKAWVARRDTNGLVKAGAIVDLGHRLLIHRARFNGWLSDHLAKPAQKAPKPRRQPAAKPRRRDRGR